MTKQEFLDGLKRALLSTGSERMIRENLSFYNEYIETEIKKGRSEEDVLSELGDPRLIANSIKEAAGIEDEFIGNVQYEEGGGQSNTGYGYRENRQNFESGYRSQDGYGSQNGNAYDNRNRQNQAYNRYEDIIREDYNRDVSESHKKNKMILYGVIGGLTVALILLLILAIAVFKVLAPFLFPLLVILIVFNSFKKD